MKIKQSDLLPGDIVLMAKAANLIVVKVEKITASGSLRYIYDENREGMDYYDFKVEDINFTKKAYIAKPWKPEYGRYFWLLERPNG